MSAEIIKAIREKGLLLEKEIFDIVVGLENPSFARSFLEQLELASGQKIITKSLLLQNSLIFRQFLMSEGTRGEKILLRLGLQVELSKKIANDGLALEKKVHLHYRIFHTESKSDKKIDVSEFTAHFRARYHQLQRILMQRADLQHLVSLNKISSDRQVLDII